MAEVEPDDRIHRTEGRWIDVQGWELPVFMTYTTWVTFLLALGPAWLLAKLLPDLNLSWTWAVALCLDVVFTAWVRREVSSDKTPLGVAQHVLINTRTYLATRRANAHRETAQRPVLIRTSHITTRRER